MNGVHTGRDNMAVKLPKGKAVVLQADTDEHQRGLVVKWREDKGYDVYYWYDKPTNIVSAELKGDGKSFGQAKRVYLGFHPELDERLKKGETGCCHQCGNSHPKGGKHPTPYKTGKNSCANRKSENVNEVSSKTLDRAGKLLTYLVKYYGLKITSARQAVSDLARFL